MNSSSPLLINEINTHLTPQTAAWITQLEIFPQIDSTNSYLARQMSDYPSGAVCFAEAQTAGKGRRGREWVSPLGQNIYGSFLWHFNESPQALSGLSLAIGVGVIRALNKHGISDVGLKWSNDIYGQMKKLGGILIEMITHANGHTSAIIGLGINVSLPKEYADGIRQAYTDLQQIAPLISIQRNQLIAELLNELLPITATFPQTGFSNYRPEWCQYDCFKGKIVTLYHGHQQTTGYVHGVDDQGFLQLKDLNGTLHSYASGDVSFSL